MHMMVEMLLVSAITCLFVPLEASIYIRGDVELFGMFQVYKDEQGRCTSDVNALSVITTEAVKWYIQQLNANGNLPLTIGFRALETCRLTDKAAAIAIDLMDKNLKNQSFVAGVIGPDFSSEAEVISPILSFVPANYRLAQVGFSTTAASLNDQQKYPNFVRMIPDDMIQIKAMIKTMIALRWNRIAIVYEDDGYGREALELLKLGANENSICIALSKGLSVKNGINSIDIKSAINDIILGSGARPPINGMIFIGNSYVAKTLFLTLKSVNLSPVPIVMLSEASGLNTIVFKGPNEEVIPEAKGSFALSPPYTEVTELKAHLREIFTNATTFQLESKTNPWLVDVFYYFTECQKKNCNFTAMSETKFASALGKQSLYEKYAILATHALIKAIVTVHSNYCSNTSFCDKFRENFYTGQILRTLKATKIDTNTDFEFRLPSLANYTEDLSQPSKSSEHYEIFNFRQTDTSTDGFDLVKIGSLAGDYLSIDIGSIRDYDTNGVERPWPEVRIPQCLEKTICSECIITVNMHERILYDPGDLYIVGVVPIFDSEGLDGCGSIRIVSGYQAAESIRFAVDKANSKTGDFTNIFTGLKIGSIIINSCNNPVTIQRKLYDMYRNGIRFQNGTSISMTDKVIGFVGDIGSGTSVAVAEVLTKLKYVQISFASTSPALSDREKYPYFMRVVTPDDVQSKAMVEVLKKLQANFVQIVYSAGAYGEWGRDVVKELARQNKICVINAVELEEAGNPYAIYEQLRKNKFARIVILFIQSHKVISVLNTLTSQMEIGEFVFIGSETWATRTDLLKLDKNQALLGSFSLALEIQQNSELKTHMQNLKPRPYKDNPWVMTYLQAKNKCYFTGSFNKSEGHLCQNGSAPDFQLDFWDTSAFLAAKSLILGANVSFKQTCGSAVSSLCSTFTDNPKSLVGEIIKLREDVDGSGIKAKVFNDNGDGNAGYRIYNIQKDPDDPLKLVYKQVGRFPAEGLFTFEVDRTVGPLGKTVSSTCPNDDVCKGCFQTSNAVNEITDDVARKETTLPQALGAVVGITVLIIICLIIAIVILRKKRTFPENIVLADDGGYLTPSQATASEGYSDIPFDLISRSRQFSEGSAGSITSTDKQFCRNEEHTF